MYASMRYYEFSMKPIVIVYLRFRSLIKHKTDYHIISYKIQVTSFLNIYGKITFVLFLCNDFILNDNNTIIFYFVH